MYQSIYLFTHLSTHPFSQAAARSFMSETLSLGRRLRPNYLWGFYLFPNCYNHGWLEPGYTGRCSPEVRAQNDQLLWLWEASSALYPSVYLQVQHNTALYYCHWDSNTRSKSME